MFVKKLLLLLTFFSEVASGSVESPLPEWQLFLEHVDEENIQSARQAFSQFISGKADVSEVSDAKSIVRAAVIGVALTEFLKKDFLEKHPDYTPGQIYRLVLKCAEKGFDKETEKLLWKAQGSSAREFGSELFFEGNVISSFNFKDFQFRYLIATLFLPLFFSYQVPGAYAFIIASSITSLIPLFISQNTAGFFPTRNGKEPQLWTLLTKEEKEFEHKISEAVQIARIDRNRVAAVYDLDRGPRIPAFFVPASLFAERPRRIVVSSARGRLFKMLSTKEVAAVLRHEHQHLQQKIFPWLFFIIGLLGGALSFVQSNSDNRLATRILAWLARISLMILLLVATRYDEAEADSAAVKFAAKEWGERKGRQIFATALEKLLLFTRARQPPFILKKYLKNTLKAGDPEHGDPLHRISLALSEKKPSAER